MASFSRLGRQRISGGRAGRRVRRRRSECAQGLRRSLRLLRRRDPSWRGEKGLRMKRSTLRRFSRVRGGLSRCQRDDLRELCREVVMTRAKAFLFEEGKKRSWQGECAICGKVRWLQVCHILSQGQYPRAAFMPDNCFPGCW